jgi:hypothetical protein
MDEPNRSHLTDVGDGFLSGKRFLIHDRDPRFTEAFRETLAAADVESVGLPARSPNLNAYAERFVESSRNPVWSGSCSSAKRRFEEQCVNSRITIITNAITRA